MANIIRATTPTIKYTFQTVSVSDIVAAYLTIKQDGEILIEKDLSLAIVDEDSISWQFSQEETLLIKAGQAFATLNWKLADGTRGASRKATIVIEDNDKNEVI